MQKPKIDQLTDSIVGLLTDEECFRIAKSSGRSYFAILLDSRADDFVEFVRGIAWQFFYDTISRVYGIEDNVYVDVDDERNLPVCDKCEEGGCVVNYRGGMEYWCGNVDPETIHSGTTHVRFYCKAAEKWITFGICKALGCKNEEANL